MIPSHVVGRGLSFLLLVVFLLLFICELCTITGGAVLHGAPEVLVLNSLAYTTSLLMNHLAKRVAAIRDSYLSTPISENWGFINASRLLRSFSGSLSLTFYHFLCKNYFSFSLFHPCDAWLLVRRRASRVDSALRLSPPPHVTVTANKRWRRGPTGALAHVCGERCLFHINQKKSMPGWGLWPLLCKWSLAPE